MALFEFLVPLALLLGAGAAALAYAVRHFAHWRRKGVPFVPPLPFAGNLKDVLLFRKHVGEILHEVYNKFNDKRYVGMYFFDQPVLLVRDYSLWKTILTKDYQHFEGRALTPSPADVLFSETLFARKGQEWRDLRVKLNPAFTTGKIKRFYSLLQHRAANLDGIFDDAVRDGTPRDAMDICARYTMDAVSTVAFGVESRALLDDADPTHQIMRKAFVYSKMYTLVSLAAFVNMPLVRLLRLELVSAPLTAFLRSTIWGAARERERAGVLGARGDFLDLLLELRDKGRIAGDEDDALDGRDAAPSPKAKGAVDMDGDVLVAQAFSVLGAGFDATMATMSYAMYHMAKEQHMQEKLRARLQEAVREHNGQLTYETLQSVEYLDMIFAETLRMYPVLPFLDRMCTKAYRIPGTDVVVDKGTVVFSSTLGFQRDPELFQEPERFDPERFSEENKKNIPSGAYSPFGDGPRKCIGLRLAYVQGKLGLAHIILNYRLHPCAATPEKMEFNLHSFLIHPRDGVPLKFTRV